MIRIVRAEITKLRKRPVVWVLGGILVATLLVFGYLIPSALAGLFTAAGAPGPGVSDFFESGLLPERAAASMVSHLGGLGSWLALALGAVAVGSEYGWRTMGTLLVQGPTRVQLLAGKLIGLAVILAVFVLASLLVGLAVSVLIAVLSGEPVNWPDARDVAVGAGAAWLIQAAWAAFGAFLAILLRGSAMPIVLGLVYAVGVEVPLLIIAAQTEPGFISFLFGSSTVALSQSLAVPQELIPVPGDPTFPAIVVACYLAGFVVLSGLVFLRRDAA